MKLRARYYLWNKESDFRTGTNHNIRYDDYGMYMDDPSLGYGVYCSRVVDSGETGKIWGRAEILGEWRQNTSVTVSFFTSDNIQFSAYGISRTAQEWLSDNKYTASEKEMIFESCKTAVFSNRRDIMFGGLKGRYIWFIIRFQGSSDIPLSVKQLRIWLDNENWLSYLPEVYQSDEESADFTARFLSIFQNVYEEMNEKITRMPVYYDIESADRDFLEWLSVWIGIRNGALWSEQQLRTLLPEAVELFRKTGTPEMISRMVELYIGQKPIIIENYLTSDPSEAIRILNSKDYQKDYFGFTVIVPSDAVHSETQHQALLQIIHQCKPSHMRMQLVFVDPSWLDGAETVLPPDICLDGRSILMQRR
ncbi:MAG: hypothetical protein IJA12_06135 [Oscillospiraceae bacterium]|nr:hypothetical protein [Oscillospiraceae bacterium]